MEKTLDADARVGRVVAAVVVFEASSQKVLLEEHVGRVAVSDSAPDWAVGRFFDQSPGLPCIVANKIDTAATENTTTVGTVHAVSWNICSQFLRQPSTQT